MRRALASAQIEPGQVDYVNAHATSTPAGDRAEASALARVFGEGLQTPFISSTKGLTGHTLSMAGALETALCSLAVRDQFIPGTAGLVETDADAPKLKLPRTTLDEKVTTVLKNSSGFGGSNVCIVLRRWGA
jgi:3-oxoacyl-(acyl-carrier-protein) synthase